jgi:hypothetical protein
MKRDPRTAVKGFAFGDERQIAGSIITSRKVYDESGGWATEDVFYRLPVFVVTHRWSTNCSCTSPRDPQQRRPARAALPRMREGPSGDRLRDLLHGVWPDRVTD